MAINKTVKPTTANSPAVRVGKNSNNKPADFYAARGTSVADGERAVGRDVKDPNTLSAQQVNRRTLAMSVSVGNIGPEDKPVAPSVQIRGCGAAERGTKASSKMG